MSEAEEPAPERCPQTIRILATNHQCLLAVGHDGNHRFEIVGKKPASAFDPRPDEATPAMRPTQR